MSIFLKSAYEHPSRADGYRIVVGREWPHGVSKAAVQFDIWAKNLAPSAALATWFGHDPGKWAEFKARYFRELDACGTAIEPVFSLLSRATITLVHADDDPRFNAAAALKEYLEARLGTAPSDPGAWAEVREWRRAKRTDLLARRRAMPREAKRAAQAAVIDRLQASFPELDGAVVGIYWPIKGELDVRSALPTSAQAALPVVVIERRPLEFWSWSPGTPMSRGIWQIPIPAERRVVQPTVLLVPLLGFDAAGYRLGYGGGYYDRTLAAMDPKPLTIGVGHADAALASIHPQPHDVPMDAIVTETETKWFRLRRPSAARSCERDRHVPQFH